MASKFSNCVLCWGLLTAAGCGGQEASLFSSCEGVSCGQSSAGGAGHAGAAALGGELATSGADQGAAAGTGDDSGNGLAGSTAVAGSVGTAGASGAQSSLNGAGSPGNPSPSPGAGLANGCVSQVGAVSALSLYNGTDAACSLLLAPPRIGTWFAFDDGTLLPSANSSVSAQTGGHDPGGCYVLGAGQGATGWGGGIGFALNGSASSPCEYDATAYSGVLIYVKGSTAATQGPNYQPAASTFRVNVVTTATSDVYGTCAAADGKCNDHFGVWCTLSSGWGRCDVPFANLSQRGWGGVAHFDKARILQFQLVALRDPDAATPTSWDISADDVAFYE